MLEVLAKNWKNHRKCAVCGREITFSCSTGVDLCEDPSCYTKYRWERLLKTEHRVTDDFKVFLKTEDGEQYIGIMPPEIRNNYRGSLK